MNKFPKRGSIYVVDLDPTIGSEMAKKRPALVISNDTGNKFSSRVTIACITSKNVSKVFPIEVFLEKGEGGIQQNSKVALDQIRSVDKKRLFEHLGSVGSHTMEKVNQAIKISLWIDQN